jgi:hypothetical protein
MKKPKLKPISSVAFDNEARALAGQFKRGILTAAEHKAKWDILVKRLKMTGNKY